MRAMTRAEAVKPSREPFGQVAIRKGYATQLQVTKTLTRQQTIVGTGSAHKLIGMIMLELGSLDTTELIDVLRELDGSAPAAR